MHLHNTGTNTDSTYFVLSDNLGSITMITDEQGNKIDERSYDAWGRLRNPTDWTFTNVPVMKVTDRGYTTHEHLQPFNLINMNGRCYDPLTGRMLSPDILVSDANSTQSYNRYSYCSNNPLSYTDPTGYRQTGRGYFDVAAANSAVVKQYYYEQYGDYNNIDSQYFGHGGALLGGGGGGRSSDIPTFAYVGSSGANIIQDANGDLRFSITNAGTTTNYNVGFGSDGAYGIVTSIRGNGPRVLTSGNGQINSSAEHVETPQIVTNRASLDEDESSATGIGKGALVFVGGAIAAESGLLLISTGIGAPLGVPVLAVGLMSTGIVSMGYGGAMIGNTLQGNEEIPGGPFEAIDIGAGGKGSIGQLIDVVSGGKPETLFDKVMIGYGFYNSNYGQQIFNSQYGGGSYNRSFGQRDKTNVYIRH